MNDEDDSKLLRNLERVLEESRKLRMRLALLEYHLIYSDAGSGLRAEPPPESKPESKPESEACLVSANEDM